MLQNDKKKLYRCNILLQGLHSWGRGPDAADPIQSLLKVEMFYL